ncbi:hypothetical protein, partial [Shinella sp. AETb1-6]|uniref:hypothetical protein n=1 Tax=Shinella sp. AETb1-6 TaxID=2692210 RepID=UPI001AED87B1
MTFTPPAGFRRLRHATKRHYRYTLPSKKMYSCKLFSWMALRKIICFAQFSASLKEAETRCALNSPINLQNHEIFFTSPPRHANGRCVPGRRMVSKEENL